jgi:hypothetical protein
VASVEKFQTCHGCSLLLLRGLAIGRLAHELPKLRNHSAYALKVTNGTYAPGLFLLVSLALQKFEGNFLP